MKLGMMMMMLSLVLASWEQSVMTEVSSAAGDGDGVGDEFGSGYFLKMAYYLFQTNGSGYEHVWPDEKFKKNVHVQEMEFGWKIVVGSVVGFCGAAFGSVGGVGGGGIFVPMLTLIIGFDPKSATAISKCMIMGAAGSAVYYNLMLRHPTLDMPIIDYDLALLIQPMLMLGISIGVTFNVIFSDWMVTVLLIVLFIGTSTKAFCKGVETWKKETIMKKEATKRLKTNGGYSSFLIQLQEGHLDYNLVFFLANRTSFISMLSGSGADIEYKLLPGDGNPEKSLEQEITIFENVYWEELGLLLLVWVSFLVLQIAKNYTFTCSIWYWVLNLLQIPISFGVSGYEAVSLYKGYRKISSKGDSGTNLRVGQLVSYCSCGILAGLVGGLLGLGGGFIMGPLFLELGVSSATATFAMLFSSSMSVVEYYLLRRFPVPYALHFLVVATIAAFIGQHVVRKLIILLGRASLIIFILAFTIFVSAILLGGVGISNMIGKIEQQEYMGFENLCMYEV
ncbi:Transmembrane protein TauE like protein [Cynara cardunculus var. scolymus]|uniref:Transmembrane protein TauE like protein n=1 Tax=Cynara cardunculus var. scolymus TaxID=59895 RepID=A0A124SB65_CYNCS|nr:Transmembrane protein TauE like protein [Cynara cardunculus var. scolymus]